MLQRQRRRPPRHRNDIRHRRPRRLGTPARSGLHGRGHRRGDRLGPRPALGLVPGAGDAAEDRAGDPRADDRVRLLHGPGLHGGRVAGDLRVRARRLLPGLVVDQARQPAHVHARQRGVVQHGRRHRAAVPHLRRDRVHRRHLLRRRHRRVRRLHHPHCHPGLLCREPLPQGPVAPGQIQQARRHDGVRVHSRDDAHSVLS